MKLEIDMPEHHYNNIIAFDSVSLGRVPYKGIIMYAINAIKRGKALEQEPTTKNDLGVDREDAVERLNALKQFIGYDKESEIVKATQKSLDMAIEALEQEPRTFKWCETCKEYDQEKHCCHRWSKVIRDTVEEMKQEYIEREVLDKIDEIITDALDKSTDQKESQTLRWVLDKISEVM